MKRTVNLGIIGLGNIGCGVAALFEKNKNLINERLGVQVHLAKAADISESCRKKSGLAKEILTEDARQIINDPQIDIVVEAIGGEKPAREFILSALKKGKHVVTPNKEVIAKHLEEFLTVARANNVKILFEAAVGGGIPIICTLRNPLLANKITEVYGIVNGTTNYILTKMAQENKSFNQAVKEAQEMGFAESNPASDIEGQDAAYKAAILSAVAFRSKIDFRKVYFEGIAKIALEDLQFADRMGYAIKLLAIAKKEDQSLDVRVHPVLLPKNHLLSSVNNEINAIYIKGNAVDEQMLSGKGAGALPTGSAIWGDISEIISGNGADLELKNHYPIKSIFETESRYYVRLKVEDHFGVLEKIAGLFAGEKVSIDAVHQQETNGTIASLVIILHKVKDQNFQKAIARIKSLKVVKEVSSVIRVGLK